MFLTYLLRIKTIIAAGKDEKKNIAIKLSKIRGLGKWVM